MEDLEEKATARGWKSPRVALKLRRLLYHSTTLQVRPQPCMRTRKLNLQLPTPEHTANLWVPAAEKVKVHPPTYHLEETCAEVEYVGGYEASADVPGVLCVCVSVCVCVASQSSVLAHICIYTLAYILMYTRVCR